MKEHQSLKRYTNWRTALGSLLLAGSTYYGLNSFDQLQQGSFKTSGEYAVDSAIFGSIGLISLKKQNDIEQKKEELNAIKDAQNEHEKPLHTIETATKEREDLARELTPGKEQPITPRHHQA